MGIFYTNKLGAAIPCFAIVVAANRSQIKTGSRSRPDRPAKDNQPRRGEQLPGKNAGYPDMARGVPALFYQIVLIAETT